MGISEQMGWSNPFTDFVGKNRNTMMGFGAGLAGGRNIGQGIAYGLQGAQSGKQMDVQTAQQDQEKNATIELMRAQGFDDLLGYLENGGNMEAAANETFKRMQPGYGQMGGADNLMSVGGHIYDKASGTWISPPESADNRQNVSLTPQWGQNDQGDWVMLQPSSTGDLVQSNVPDGVKLVNPFDLNANKAGGTTYGKGIGTAQLDVPGANLIAEQTISAINDVRNEKAGMSEQFGNVLGVPQQMLPAWPGSEKAQFQVAADRAINRAFLQGREMLKGAGQITDFESKKAEAAITAAQLAMEKGDQQQFLKALDDFEQAVRDGNAKIQAQSQTMPSYGGGQQAPREYTFNPATGRLE